MSKVVFVGNVPYNMGEDELIKVFRAVGHVVGFRLVFDRDTGKPKGYGFCEFIDHETALSAVRNLNNTEVGGRPLRIDLADSDPFLEGKTTVRGEIIDGGESRAQWRERERFEDQRFDDHRGAGGTGPGAGGGGGPPPGAGRGRDPKGFLASVPPGKPVPAGQTSLDTISQTLAGTEPARLTEVLAQTKAFVISHPEQARMLFQAHPQFAYGIFQALVMNKIVDPGVLDRMLGASGSAPPNGAHPHPTQIQASPQGLPRPVPTPQPQHTPQPPPMAGYPHQPPPQGYPPHMQPQPQPHLAHMQPPPPSVTPMQHMQTQPMQYAHMPPPYGAPMYGQPQQPMAVGMPPQGYYQQPPLQSQQQRPPMQGPPGVPTPQHLGSVPLPPHTPTQPMAPQQQQQQQVNPAAMDSGQRALLMQVLQLTPDQLQALPPNERDAIQQLKNQLQGAGNGIAV